MTAHPRERFRWSVDAVNMMPPPSGPNHCGSGYLAGQILDRPMRGARQVARGRRSLAARHRSRSSPGIRFNLRSGHPPLRYGVAASRSNGLEVRLAPPSPFVGALDAVVLAEIGAPSTIAQNELRAGRRPPCAEAAGAFKERAFVLNELTVDEDLSGRRRLRCREPIAFHQNL